MREGEGGGREGEEKENCKYTIYKYIMNNSILKD